MFNFHVSKAVRYKKINNYTSYLVEEYAIKKHGFYSLYADELPELELNTLTNLYLDYYDREINDAVDDDVASAIISMLKDNTQYSRDDLSELIRKKVINQYKDEMQSLLDECCHGWLQIKNMETDDEYISMGEKS